MRTRVGVLALLSLACAPAWVFAECKIAKIAELPVTMSGSKPLVTAQINGQDARFVADSGAFYSMLSGASAAQYNLKLERAPPGLLIEGVGGSVAPSVATVRVFTIAGVPVHNVEFLVGGTQVDSASVGLLGQNFFRIGDVEYDLSHGAIRLMKVEDCRHARLAYWVTGTDSYSVMEIQRATEGSRHTQGVAYLNGAKIHVLFDTGAAASILSLRAAAEAGIKPDSPDVLDGGFSFGIGSGIVKTYIARFSSFKVGDEEIRNARLRFGDIRIGGADMLLGADFFLSHRVYVASSQGLLYFSYNGGPVFNLSQSAAKPAPADPAAVDAAPVNAAEPNPAAAKPADEPGPDEPTDAAGFSRRGSAREARHDYERALADLSRACDMSPANPDYFYQRGVIYRQNKQPAEALADFDRAITLKDDDVDALVARAQIRLESHDRAAAKADLDAANRAASKESEVRLFIAFGYGRVEDFENSVAQYDLWIAAHASDVRLTQALGGRCHGRALLGKDLAGALSDCNAALKGSTQSGAVSANVLANRGLVRLRMGDYSKSVSDYDAALKIEPQSAWALYGRGIANLRQKNISAGNADIAAATALSASVAPLYNRYGLSP
jgi:tetratricopeptide (TPR) repeat protein/predicted aspartyl protease